jgi:hypothetical protein
MKVNARTLLIIFGVIAVIAVILIIVTKKSNENFATVGKPSQVPDGVYMINNIHNLPLTSNIIDTVMCKDFLIGTQDAQPTPDKHWLLKRVASSVYILYKVGKKECLYTHPTNTVRSYFFPSCDTKNLCGLETPDAQGELDQDSVRTYFMLLEHPSGKHYIKSMKNNKYLCMNKKQISFRTQPNDDCLFDLNLVSQE